MDQEQQKQRQAFLDLIANYQYITEDGRLILEPFCVYLSHCFGFDGILEKSPQPRDVYFLLLELIREQLGDEEAHRKIETQRIADWTPEMVYIFPEKTMTRIHTAALVHVSHDWIYEIGHTLMGITEPDEIEKYFDWVNEEWLAVYTFINGYHNAFASFLKRFDRESIEKTGYSRFEALHLARTKDISFDEAVELLKTRHESYQSALAQISEALRDGYFLEAIALEECLISHCLFNFLSNTGTTLSNPSFHTLLTKILTREGAAYDFPHELFREVNKWRESRNTAIHGFITSRTGELSQSRTDFRTLTEATARAGDDFCKSIVTWHELECVNFIRHEFPSRLNKALH